MKLRDGRVLEAREPDGRGGAGRPLEPQAVVAKFRDNAARALGAASRRRLEEMALGLDALDDLGAFMKLCRA